MLRSDQARLWSRRNEVFGCARGGRQVYRNLAVHGGCFPDGCYLLRALSGRFAALIRGTAGRTGSFVSLRVNDLRNGRSRHRWQVDSGDARAGERTTTGAFDVVVNRRGSVAWTVDTDEKPSDQPPTTPRMYEVLRSDLSGEAVVLDASAEIDPNSLELAGSTLRWMNAGQARTAMLR
jgi:hypothetical protein